MLDLHLHLDGSLSPEFILKQAQKDHVPLPAHTPDSLLPYLTVGASCDSLNTYLEKFDLPVSVLQTEDALEGAVQDLIRRLSAQGLEYAEIRFAPQLHTARGLSQEAVTEAALSGLHSACREFHFSAGLILCCMRTGGSFLANEKTLAVARSFLRQGVVALDLAGAEALYKTSDYKNLFRLARANDIPFTIHAGEADGADSIRAALEFGASRIGHGVHCMEDPALLEELVQKQIPLEICPTSNLQTHACASLKEHPVLKLLRMGICVTINTDNMTVSDTTLSREYALLKDQLHMTEEEKEQTIGNARKARFH